ncbi:DUF4031 domain-containing protein [Brachybacterium endophyticum]|uniref:DUF4031 domain-containing protein n=1 Tax=Brachybacterium endophyticum TaxID=2182385 RepID=A0A2U2RP64_9MICO|nr:DUF4031 domain-containing protein [Brachybacterium endophyticum]PWH07650.1 DUF4031 domain-containing protein [Brachybacterium endophyticum]
MTVFADTPRWERHGMLWGHLISDASLSELHLVAARGGLHPRSFDLDHYDWPESAREGLEAVGVTFVGNGDLTRRLIASGLRVPAARRAEARRERAERGAVGLGLDHVPEDLVTGLEGHAAPLPPVGEATPGTFRLTRDSPCALVRIEAHDELGRAAAWEFLARADVLSNRATGHSFVGQVLDVPD